MFFFRDHIDLNFNRAVSERRLFEDMRAAEKLSSSAYQDFADGGKIKVYVRNVGSVPLRVLRVWVVDKTTPDIPNVIITDLFLNAFQSGVVINTGIVPVVNKQYNVFLITERGNLIVPVGSPIIGKNPSPPPTDPQTFPYTLSVTLKNTLHGAIYNLTLKGNLPGGKTTLFHRATATRSDVSLDFGVYPGNYTLIVNGTRLGTLLVLKTLQVTVPDVSNVLVNVGVAPIVGFSAFGDAPYKVCVNELFVTSLYLLNTGTVDLYNFKITFDIVDAGWDLFSTQIYQIPKLAVDEIATFTWSVRAPSSPATTTFKISISGKTEANVSVDDVVYVEVTAISC
ncbi:MAG: hypothetical protein NZ920_06190 [Aigarchaeota archaeon]|nr:hypothetical protein [Aigarchaeota archaeon]MDW8092696.1 hypothetical protein [Nitrososphaerota archaeon]